jgi:hypothetical protein
MTRYEYEVVEIGRRGNDHLERQLNQFGANGQRVVAVLWQPESDEGTGGSYEVWLEREEGVENM